MRRRAALAVAGLVWFVGRGARGAGGPADDAYDDVRQGAAVDVHAQLDVYAQHDLRQPASGQVPLRAFDVRSDALTLGLLRVGLAHRPEPFGFRLDLGAGALADGYEQLDPGRLDAPGLARALSYVQQAFASVAIADALVVDVGKFGTPLGLEDNEALPNWCYSRSLLYTLAEPSYHAGLRATTTLGDAVALSGFWLDGWDANVTDGNGMRSGGVAASWTPAKEAKLALVYVGGLEHPVFHPTLAALSMRHEVDAIAVVSPRPWLTMAVTADDGIDAADGGVSWWGVGGYLRGSAAGWFAVTARAEHLEDPDGFISGARETLVEGTLTLEGRTEVGPMQLVGRLEARRDQSDARVFPGAAGAAPALHQDTVTAALMTGF